MVDAFTSMLDVYYLNAGTATLMLDATTLMLNIFTLMLYCYLDAGCYYLNAVCHGLKQPARFDTFDDFTIIQIYSKPPSSNNLRAAF